MSAARGPADARAVIFDMDGVLSDTERLHVEVESVLLARHGVTLTPDDLARYAGLRDRDFFRAALHGREVDVEALVADKRRALLALPARAIGRTRQSAPSNRMYPMSRPVATWKATAGSPEASRASEGDWRTPASSRTSSVDQPEPPSRARRMSSPGSDR